MRPIFNGCGAVIGVAGLLIAILALLRDVYDYRLPLSTVSNSSDPAPYSSPQLDTTGLNTKAELEPTVAVYPTQQPTNTPFSSDSTTSINLSGTWVGRLEQPGWEEKGFYFEMNLSHSGENIEGSSRIAETNEPQYTGVFNLTGTIQENIFYFQEKEIVYNEPKPGKRWCEKSGALYYRLLGNTDVLEGSWTGDGDCYPGTLRIERQR